MTRMMRRLGWRTALVALTLTAGWAAFAPPPASAHERRVVAGKYAFVVGFLEEPAYVEEGNGVSLVVTDTQNSNRPVEGVEKTLKVEVTTAGQSKVFDLRTVFNREGGYQAQFIPTKEGSYTFRFFGTIAGTEINEKFESGPGRFDDIQGKAAAQFPAPVPTNGELAQQVRGGSTSPAPAAGGDIQDAIDKANSARTTGLVTGGAGILVGLAGLAVALMALRGRSATPANAAPRSGSEPV